MIVFRRRFVTLAEVRFGTDPGKAFTCREYPGIDIVNFMHHPAPVPGARFTESHTLLNDLEQPPETIMAAFNRTTRNEISRAQRMD